LAEEYQALYWQYKEDPAYKDRLDEILTLNSSNCEISKRGGDKMSMNNQLDIYAPLLAKTFETAVSNFILTEFPTLGGPKVIELFVKELKSIVEHYYPPITNLRMGQMLWFAVAKDEKGGYGKSMKNLRLRPFILSPVTYEDIQKRPESVSQKEIRKSRIARLLKEADKQGGTLAESDVSLILSCSLRTIQKNITEYERENNVGLPSSTSCHTYLLIILTVSVTTPEYTKIVNRGGKNREVI
jgi:hypothetical protein